MSLDIVVNDSLDDEKEEFEHSNLADWILERVEQWKQHRDSNYREKWHEYYRLWRGIWDSQDKTRHSEKSKLISPALQQAVEATVSELEEATFGSGTWFDLEDDPTFPQNIDPEKLKATLTSDLERAGCKTSLSEILLYGAIYGTGIGELTVDIDTRKVPQDKPVPGAVPGTFQRGVQAIDQFAVKLNPISPLNFIIDPTSTSIDNALGAAIEELTPRHKVLEGMKNGYYDEKDVGVSDWVEDTWIKGETARPDNPDAVKLTKYYGLVPVDLLNEAKGGDPASTSTNDDEDEESYDEFVEAIVVIANDGIVIKAIKNPYMLQDRPLMAYQHDRVPGRFWGRGICEKGYNPQKALDAELRARLDALSLTTHPMMALDATRLPRGSKFEIRPGQTILTNGDPKSILMPLHFGTLDGISYRESADLERMVQMATGAMDAASSPDLNSRNATASGMSMIQAGSIKRQKRTLANFQESFLIPFIKKSAWRYMQFEPQRYPAWDFKFKPMSSLGIMARELEQQQLISLLSLVPPDSPAHMVMLKAIYANSSLSNREELEQIIDQMMNQPPNPQAQQQQQLQMQLMASQIAVNNAKAYETQQKPQLEIMKTGMAHHDTPNDTSGDSDVQLKLLEMQREFEARFAELDLQKQKLHLEAAKVGLQHIQHTNTLDTQKEIAANSNKNNDGQSNTD